MSYRNHYCLVYVKVALPIPLLLVLAIPSRKLTFLLFCYTDLCTVFSQIYRHTYHTILVYISVF